MTLALLLTAVTGAWAQDLKELTVPSEWNNDETYLAVDEMTGFKDFSSLTEDEAKALINSVPTGKVIIIYGAEASSNSFKLVQNDGDDVYVGEIPLPHETLFSLSDNYKYYYTTSDAIEVTPVAGKTNEWTFSMPGSDVVLTPQYAPAAQLAENGAPAAVSGLEIAADAAIITAGQSAQGTLLYAVGTSQTEKPALTAFAATLPNAKDQTAAGTYYVWYYIQGQDTPQGQEPTAENTFNDSEIMGPVKVELLTNEHTLNIKQSPNITVTVAGTAKTPTDDKVTPVTTGQEVKIKAKDGYKFRKVEVKKGAPAPADVKITSFTLSNYDGFNIETYCYSDIVIGNITPSNATDQTFTWSASGNVSVSSVSPDTKTCTIEASGSSGSGTITATANDGSGVSVTRNITVFRRD